MARLQTVMMAAALAAAMAMAVTGSISEAAAEGRVGANACEAHIIQAARKYDIPPGILYAVGLAETGRKGSLHPHALNVEGRAVFAASAADALSQFQKARAGGAKLIDLGCMQINHHYHAQAFRGVRDMLDPARNVEYAARFLKELKGRHGTWSMAVARYHAGPDNDPAQKRYICRVIANLVATGFGSWTPQARGFCNPG